MRKLFGAVFALALTAVVLTGCRGNVSDHENGRITNPTMMPETIATMPSTDTVPPMTTMPTVTTQPTRESTSPTGDTGSTEGSGTTGNSDSSSTPGSGAKARPNRSMG